MIQKYLQTIASRQIIIGHPIQTQRLECGIQRHKERVTGAGDVRRQIGQIQKTCNVRETFVALEGEECVR